MSPSSSSSSFVPLVLCRVNPDLLEQFLQTLLLLIQQNSEILKLLPIYMYPYYDLNKAFLLSSVNEKLFFNVMFVHLGHISTGLQFFDNDIFMHGININTTI